MTRNDPGSLLGEVVARSRSIRHSGRRHAVPDVTALGDPRVRFESRKKCLTPTPTFRKKHRIRRCHLPSRLAGGEIVRRLHSCPKIRCTSAPYFLKHYVMRTLIFLLSRLPKKVLKNMKSSNEINSFIIFENVENVKKIRLIFMHISHLLLCNMGNRTLGEAGLWLCKMAQ